MAADGISVIVRARNDGRFIARTLSVLSAQKIDLPVEILCCDDDSSDGTPDLIRSFPGVRNVPRPGGPYRPGRTLNHLVRLCGFGIVVFNNADSVPQGETFLSALTEPLRSGRADAVYARQIPRPDAEFLVRKDYARAFGDGKIAEKWNRFFSLASSAAFREDLLAHPFREDLLYSEDVEWVHRRNLRIVYVPKAEAEHSHDYSMRELWRRFYGEGCADGEIFGKAPGFFGSLFRAGAESLRDVVFLLPRPAGWREFPLSPVRRLIQQYARRKGAKDYLGGKKDV